MKILYLDCFSGISGDMLLGAFIDLGVPDTVIEAAIRKLPVPDIKMASEKVLKQGLSATSITFNLPRKGVTAHSYADIKTMVRNSRLSEKEKEETLKIFKILAVAESQVHGIDVDTVHFHEVGALDSICDIVGAAVAKQYLGFEKVYVSALPMGRGSIRCEHGILPNPAPATTALLTGFTCVAIPYTGEFVTPTGAAIVRAWAVPEENSPPYSLLKTGFGAGSMDIPDRPNVLRVFVGETGNEEKTPDVVWLETDIDDTTPEVLAYVAEELFSLGALDVSSHAVSMKKGRIGTRLSAMALQQDSDALCALLFTETSTLGIRITPVTRRTLRRETCVVATSLGDARVKISHFGSGNQKISPEYEDCAALARRHGLPLREVMTLVIRESEKCNNGL